MFYSQTDEGSTHALFQEYEIKRTKWEIFFLKKNPESEQICTDLDPDMG